MATRFRHARATRRGRPARSPARALRAAARPYARFHYRQIAASHMMKAADELPARSQAYAAVCQGTRFVINDAPDVAAKMYRRYVETGAVVPFSGSFGQECAEPDFKGAARFHSCPGLEGLGTAAPRSSAACWPPACWRWRRRGRCAVGLRGAARRLSSACVRPRGRTPPSAGAKAGCNAPSVQPRSGKATCCSSCCQLASRRVGSDRSRVDEGVAPGAIQVFQQRQAHHAGRVAQQHRRQVQQQLIHAARRYQRAAQARAGLDVDFIELLPPANASWRAGPPCRAPRPAGKRRARCAVPGGAPWPHPRGR